jgi:hypothetical protein
MYRSLHRLLLVLPDRPRFSIETAGAITIRLYHWPCGCAAKGRDESNLDVRLCSAHLPFLVPAVAGKA